MELSATSVNNQLFLWRQNVTMTDSHKYITVSLLYVCRRNPSSNIHFVLWVNVYLFKCYIEIKFKWLNIAEKRTFVFIYCVLCNIKSLIINLNLLFNPIQMNFYHKNNFMQATSQCKMEILLNGNKHFLFFILAQNNITVCRVPKFRLYYILLLNCKCLNHWHIISGRQTGTLSFRSQSRWDKRLALILNVR